MHRIAIVITLFSLLFLTTWPTHPFVGHSHWNQVVWLPSNGFVPIDFAANVALFVPFGFVIAWPGHPRAMRNAVIAALALSLFAELYQVYCHYAFPSASDVLANTLGAWLGTAALWLRRRAGSATVANSIGEGSAT